MNTLLNLVAIGIGATAVMDVWGLARQRLLGVAAPNYALVGRWIAQMPRGRFRHARIAAVPAARGERVIGWMAHYIIGISFAALLPLVAGHGWLHAPTLLPALGVGLLTVLAPFLLMQPGMGAGLAARLTPRPWQARMHSLITHGVFGLGLYLAAVLISQTVAA